LKIQVSLKGRFKELFQVPGPIQLEMAEGQNVRDLLKLLCSNVQRSTDIFYNSDERLNPMYP
jgi:hypothetical protein